MTSRFLFPHYCKRIGWAILIPGLVLGYFSFFRNYNIPGFSTSRIRANNPNVIDVQQFTNSLALALVIAGAMLVAFAKEKIEDELTTRIRHNALYWSILINYSLCTVLIIAAIIKGDVFYDYHNILGSFGYIAVIAIYNLFSVLIIFLLRYHYLLYSKMGQYKLGGLSFLPYYPYRVVSKWATRILFVPAALTYTNWPLPYSSEIIAVLSLSLLVWVFSRQKREDEMISTIRMESMQLAIYFVYGFLLLSDFFIYGNAFFYIMMFNLVGAEAFFLIRFHFAYNKLLKDTRE
ncbi:hypothetical protein FO440_05410 [Mucilaginibacter corticis]|uniref:Uncharacterized protein n=1 Tax=Mucilaginibacter corticis TaxID=2597670 RepID=A0A556MUP5_9SPHI|nr:hypothetical protein [Mucilaginibacter corticis]TSJ43627.1 hypothetical protein FO440_05410 [Mucilaginibacter corticis]